jgi:hypothetical protein
VRAALRFALLLAVSAGGCSHDDDPGFRPTGPLHQSYADASAGSALEDPVEMGAYGALKPEEFMDVALVALRNVTDGPVRVIGAEPVWVDPGIHARAFGLSPPGARTSGTRRDEHSTSSLPFEDAPAIQPIRAGGPEPLITFEVELGARVSEGVVVGIDVFYEQDGKVRWQRWPLTILLCDWDGHPDGCEGYKGRSIDELDFEPLLAELTAQQGPAS